MEIKKVNMSQFQSIKFCEDFICSLNFLFGIGFDSQIF